MTWDTGEQERGESEEPLRRRIVKIRYTSNQRPFTRNHFTLMAAEASHQGARPPSGHGNLRRRVAALGQPCPEEPLLDVAVGLAVSSITKIALAQLVAEQRDNPVLGVPFNLPNPG